MKKELQPLSSILEEVFKKKASPLSEGYFLSQLNYTWNDLAGCEIAKIALPIAFKNHRLTLSLPSSSHIQDMHFVKEILRKKINQAFPDKQVRRIQFQIREGNKRFYLKFFK